MTKLQDRQTGTTYRELPELPEDVVVPDDASSLKFPSSIDRRTATGVRWMPWVAALIVIAMVGALVGTFVSRDSETEFTIRTRSSQLIQQSIDEALAEMEPAPAYVQVERAIEEALAERQAAAARPAYVIVQDYIDAALAERQAAAAEQTPAYLLVQQSIDQALAERQAAAVEQTPAYLLVQQSIDQALAERQASSVRQLSAYELVQQSIDEALAAR